MPLTMHLSKRTVLARLLNAPHFVLILLTVTNQILFSTHYAPYCL